QHTYGGGVEVRRLLEDHLGHPLEGVLLDALRKADDGGAGLEAVVGGGEDVAEGVAGHTHEDEGGAFDGGVDVGRGRESNGQVDAGQVGVVAPLGVDLPGQF